MYFVDTHLLFVTIGRVFKSHWRSGRVSIQNFVIDQYQENRQISIYLSICINTNGSVITFFFKIGMYQGTNFLSRRYG